MKRYRVTIEYDGTRYSGWQIQKNARTVQGEIEAAIRRVLKDGEFNLQGSGRTDAGVHAIAQVAHLDAETMLAPHILCMKLNDEMPPDINILDISPAARAFHARHSAVARSYLYQISRRRTAFGKKYVWWVRDSLNVDAMRKASRLFVGMKDLRSFSDDDPGKKSTKVLIEDITIHESDDLILLRVTGSHFLWKSVRRIVGVLTEVGRGALPEMAVKEFLRKDSEAPARLTAPSSGLFLEKVYYGAEPKAQGINPVISISHERH